MPIRRSLPAEVLGLMRELGFTHDPRGDYFGTFDTNEEHKGKGYYLRLNIVEAYPPDPEVWHEILLTLGVPTALPEVRIPLRSAVAGITEQLEIWGFPARIILRERRLRALLD